VTLLDTHAWLWWLSEPSILGNEARQAIDGARSTGTLGVSTISVWEAALLVKKGRLELKMSVSDLVTHCEQLPFLRFISVSPKIALEAVKLEPFHADPADRFIVASTLNLGATLVTKDKRIHESALVKAVW